jgi:hypothetical protein
MAKVPGTGDQNVVFTSEADVGAFVAASLDLKMWPENSRMVGDMKPYNEVIKLAENVKGEASFFCASKILAHSPESSKSLTSPRKSCASP